MAAEWTAAERERFLAACGLDGSRPDIPRVTAPRGPTEGRRRREMHIGGAEILPFTEWRSKASYLCLGFYISDADRAFCETLLDRHFLTSEQREWLEEIWARCMGREREAADARHA
jgi:hypothetical protein